jgi:hypothetical protein
MRPQSLQMEYFYGVTEYASVFQDCRDDADSDAIININLLIFHVYNK